MSALRFFFRAICAGVLILAVVEVVFLRPARSSEGQAEGIKHEESSSSPSPSREGDSAATIAKELENKKLELEGRERGIAEQEQRLKEREQELDKKLKSMERLRAEVSHELDSQRKNNEERVVKMVGVFETMSPKSAAGVLEALDDWLSVEVLKRMDVKRVAKVMNVMDKSRSAKLSEMMTGYYHPESDRRVSSVKEPTNNKDSIKKTKGGEK